MEKTTPDIKTTWESLEEILSMAEAANIIGLAAHTLAQQAAKGHLRARKFGHTWITTRSWLDDYIAFHSRRQKRAG